MKVLWIVNIIFPFPASKLGVSKSVTLGWLYGLYNSIVKESGISLAIATTYKGKEFKKFYDGETIYYLLPCRDQSKYDKKLKKYWKMVVDDFNPDLVHIHGSEYAHALPFVELFDKMTTITSIQGLCSEYSKVYYGNIEFKDLILNTTMRDVIKADTFFQQRKKFYNRGKNEIELLKKSKYLIGRTSWDYANTFAITGQNKYFFCNESLRDEFYENKWDIKEIERNTIFVSQSYYPIKGFHILLKSLFILKKQYPNIKCYVSGYKIIPDCRLKGFRINSYAHYIDKLIKKYDLKDNIVFLGLLDTKEMIYYLKKSNVYVQPSIIENSPNSLGEAMLLGMPCVSSCVGGVSDLLVHNKEGFTYPVSEPAMLAYYIKTIFDNDSLAIELGKNAHKHAMTTHDRKINSETTISIYQQICNQKGRCKNERENKK